LLELGVDKDKIVMFPFPLRASFENITKSKEEIKKNYNIDDKKKIMLVSPGGSGISNIPEFIKMAYKNNMPYNILNVCGRNDQLKEELEQLIKKRNSNTNLIPLGYVENMNELLYIADFVVAKLVHQLLWKAS
jgi:processive 1,2-diacylglycerol beta-glucosyltransferase